MEAASEDDVARKNSSKTEKEPTSAINLRVPESLSEEIEDGRRMLEILGRANGEDAPDTSKAIRRVIRLGLDVLFGKNGGRPKTEQDWAAFEEAKTGKPSGNN